MGSVLTRSTTIVDRLTLLLGKGGGGDMPAADVVPTDSLTGKLPATLILQRRQRIGGDRRQASPCANLIDTSDNYHNESYIGVGTQNINALSPQPLICTKLSKPQAILKFDKTITARLTALCRESFDILLLHWPYPFCYNIMWKAMEALYEKGAVKAIGVCNFDTNKLELIKKKHKFSPQINQIELHPMMQQKDICRYCTDNNIQIMAYSPLARMDKRLINNTVLVEIAKHHNKNVPQIILRWDIQHGYIPIPESSTEKHIISNINIFDFELSDDEMNAIDALDCGMRVRFDPDKRFNVIDKTKYFCISVLYCISSLKKFASKKYSICKNIFNLYFNPKRL